MNLGVEQFVLIILMVLLLYFVMNNRSCNIEGIDDCPKGQPVDACALHYTNCENRYTRGADGVGYHTCKTRQSAPPLAGLDWVGRKIGGKIGSGISDATHAVGARCESSGVKCKLNNPCNIDGKGNFIEGITKCYDVQVLVLTTSLSYHPPNIQYTKVYHLYFVEDKMKRQIPIVTMWETTTGPGASADSPPVDMDGNSNSLDKDLNDLYNRKFNIMKKLYDELGIRRISIENNVNNIVYNTTLRFETNKAQTLRFSDKSGDNYTIGTKMAKVLASSGFHARGERLDDNWVRSSIEYDSEQNMIEYIAKLA
jgi:hypothetical protein